jgi:hypothetical protein
MALLCAGCECYASRQDAVQCPAQCRHDDRLMLLPDVLSAVRRAAGPFSGRSGGKNFSRPRFGWTAVFAVGGDFGIEHSVE